MQQTTDFSLFNYAQKVTVIQERERESDRARERKGYNEIVTAKLATHTTTLSPSLSTPAKTTAAVTTALRMKMKGFVE